MLDLREKRKRKKKHTLIFVGDEEGEKQESGVGLDDRRSLAAV